MLPLATHHDLLDLATRLVTAYAAAEQKVLRRLRIYSRPAPVRIKVHATAK